MRTLGGSLRRNADAGGAFLPDVFRPMADAKMRARMGTATFVAGPPGAMKTGFTLYYLLRLGLPTLYMSADAEDFEMDERAAAAISGDTMEQVRRTPEKYRDMVAANASHIRLVFEDSPTYRDLELEVAAYAEVYGEFPKVIAIDNLMNLVGEQENEWGAMRDSARVIHKLTRITKAALFVLHHMADDRADPTEPAPRSKLQGKVGQLPKAIWSLALNGDRLLLAPVKNRWGPTDASGKTYVELWTTPANSRVYNSRYDMVNEVPA